MDLRFFILVHLFFSNFSPFVLLLSLLLLLVAAMLVFKQSSWKPWVLSLLMDIVRFVTIPTYMCTCFTFLLLILLDVCSLFHSVKEFFFATSTHMHTHTHARTHTCTHAHTHVRTHAHTHACTHTHALTHTHTHTHTRAHTHTHTHTLCSHAAYISMVVWLNSRLANPQRCSDVV